VRITSVESWMLRFPYNRYAGDALHRQVELVGVYIRTENVRGMGYTYTLTGGGESIKALLDFLLIPRVVGRSLDEIETIWRDLWWLTHRLGKGVSMLAIAALDIALWDARARLEEKPLHRLLGTFHTRLPVYGSGRASPDLSLDELLRATADYMEQGFRAVKIRIGQSGPEEDLRRLRAVRKLVGDDVRLMVDANETLTLSQALWYGRRLEELDVFWFEEPLLSEDIDGHAQLQAHLDLPIAVGEHLLSRYEFQEYIKRGAATIFQPDAAICGGVTEWLKIARLADAASRPIAPHFLTELHVVLAATAPNTIYVEYFPFMDEFWQDSLEVRDGCVIVPERPGHGLSFVPEMFERYRVA
jgi:L-alanine-DL-glutamate epimerase-like enolase superfamily enzyme